MNSVTKFKSSAAMYGINQRETAKCHMGRDTARFSDLGVNRPLYVINAGIYHLHQLALQLNIALGHKTAERFVSLAEF